MLCARGDGCGRKRPAAIAIDGIFLNDDYDLDNVQMSDVERVDVFKGRFNCYMGSYWWYGCLSQ